jgi:hypothetical protein
MIVVVVETQDPASEYECPALVIYVDVRSKRFTGSLGSNCTASFQDQERLR